ncbi:MAG: hypothetical protein CMK09_08175 [Ponticaulis sp.]|nr:hypothetical protein [Ponticaulis sp.]|tara:strand:- start:24603 stop:24884 length:282 start_codon:yes stop_codon:yes gene_type:complete
MTTYLVRMRGEHFPLHDNGRWRLYGFFTERAVEAESAEEAEMVGVHTIQTDPVWNHVRPRPGFPTPRIFPEEVIELDAPVFPDEDYEFFEMKK